MSLNIKSTYESLAEFLAYLRETPVAWPNCKSAGKSTRWNGGVTFEQAMTLAEFGWPDGRENLSSVVADFEPDTIEVESAETITLDVAGGSPNVPLAVAGDPCCMMDIQRMEVPSRIIKVVMDMSVSAAISAEQVILRNAAMLSYVDALEQAGWRCEVWAFEQSKGIMSDALMTLEICVKRAEDHLDIDRMAFALVHPAMLRRLCFRWTETFVEAWDAYRYSYGAPTHKNPGDCDVFIKGARNNRATKVDNLRDVGDLFNKRMGQETEVA